MSHLRGFRATLNLLAIAALCAAPLGASPPQQPSPTFARTAHIADSLVRAGLPSIVIGVAQGGRVVWQAAFGFADLERRIPARPQTIYAVASVTKPITATAVMGLGERGQLDLDAPLSRYLGGPRFATFVGNDADVTARRVLDHSSGLPDYWEFYYADAPRERTSIRDVVAHFGFVADRPDRSARYSNLGYGLLGVAIANVSGVAYDAYVARQIFRPLGMTRSQIGLLPAGSDSVAVRYDQSNRALPMFSTNHPAASEASSTVPDLLRFGMFHLEQLNAADSVPSVAGRRLMQRPNPRVRVAPRGLGWVVARTSEGAPIVQHGGVMPGVGTLLRLHPDENAVVVVLTNRIGSPVVQVANAAMAELLDSNRARPVGNPAGSPPPWDAFAGAWVGTQRAYTVQLPVRLSVGRAGPCSTTLGSGASEVPTGITIDPDTIASWQTASPLKSGIHALRSHTLAWRLRREGNRLVGDATASAVDFATRIEFGLPAVVELARDTSRAASACP